MLRTTAIAMSALMNALLTAGFIWLAFHPFTLYGKPPDHDFAYLTLCLYSLSNIAALLVPVASTGYLLAMRRLSLGFNVFLVGIALLVGVASALESIFSGLEIFMTLCLLVPPAITTMGLLARTKRNLSF